MVKRTKVEVIFLSEDKGGRRFIPDLTDGSYRPHFRVPMSGTLLGIQFYDGPETASFNTPLLATVDFIYEPEVNYSSLTLGAKFDILEGYKIVGHGRIIDILS